MTDRSAGADVVRLLRIASVVLITLVAFENLAVTTVMPVVSEELRGLRLYALAAGAPLAAQLVGTVVAGAWADRRGPTAPLLTGTALFAVGLTVAGTAPGMEIFVLGRAVQGFGGGLAIVPLYVLVGAVVPATRQPGFFAAFSAAWVVPALIGPGVAGVLADRASWRWILLGVAVAVALLAPLLLVVLRRIPGVVTGGSPGGRRLLLAATAAGAAVALLQAVGALEGGWVVPAALAALAVLAVAVPLLVPAGTLRLVPGVPAAVACRALLNATFITAQVFIPLLLVREHGWPVARAGLALTTASVAWAVGSTIQSRVRSPATRAWLGPIGPLLLATGAAVTAGAALPGVTPWIVIVGWAIGGTGMGLVYPALAVMALQVTPRERHGAVSSALQVADSLGAALGLAGSGALFAALVGQGGTRAYLAGLLLAAAVGLLATVAGRRATT